MNRIPCIYMKRYRSKLHQQERPVLHLQKQKCLKELLPGRPPLVFCRIVMDHKVISIVELFSQASSGFFLIKKRDAVH